MRFQKIELVYHNQSFYMERLYRRKTCLEVKLIYLDYIKKQNKGIPMLDLIRVYDFPKFLLSRDFRILRIINVQYATSQNNFGGQYNYSQIMSIVFRIILWDEKVAHNFA